MLRNINNLILFIILFGASAIVAQRENRKTETFQVPKDGELEVFANPGDITIDTWDKNEVVIKMRGEDENSDLDDLTIDQKNKKIIVRYDSRWGWSESIDFLITIPKSFNVSLSTTGGDVDFRNDVTGNIDINSSAGDITMANVSGKLSLNTQGGDIRLRDVNGDLDVNTQGGEIRVGKITGKTARVNTQGGDISITSIGSDAKVKTYGGEIRIGDIDGNADVTTYGGDVELGNVGGSVKMETYGGNLSLQSANGEVDASTYAGDIDLKNVKGSVRAKTNAGNINAELYPTGKNRSILKTSNGEVTLFLPENAKANIDASIQVRGWWKEMKDEFYIKSDFSGGTNKFNDDEKEITANYTLNGGGEKITISTFNSNIKIRKIRSGK